MSEQFSLFDCETVEESDFEKFKDRKVKAREIFTIKEIGKEQAYKFVKKYHYLKDSKFFAKFSFGLFVKRDNFLVGVATYSNPQGTETLKGWFSLENTDQSVLELSRLCLLPELNGTNATSFLLSNSMKVLKRYGIRAVITLADSSRHVGSIYQVCNFKYFGLSDSKSDFYRFDGKKNVRGKVKDVRGFWIPRTRKHRYAYIFDETLKCNYEEQERPKQKEQQEQEYKCEYCLDTHKIYDSRNDEYFDCPFCCANSKLVLT